MISLIRGVSAVAGVVFLLVLVLSVVKHEDRHLLGVPALLLCLAAFAGIYFYVFQQNWFYTIIFDDFWGYGYVSLLATILGSLIDIVYLDGRITRGIVNGIADALSKCGIPVG